MINKSEHKVKYELHVIPYDIPRFLFPVANSSPFEAAAEGDFLQPDSSNIGGAVAGAASVPEPHSQLRSHREMGR